MHKNIKLVTIDGDGTLFSYKNVGSKHHSSWDALGFAYNLGDIWNRRAKREYQIGKDDYGWARNNILELAGRKVEDSFKILYPIPFCEGAKEFSNASKGKFIRGILSSALDLIINRSKMDLELDFAICNVIHYKNGIFTGDFEHNVPLWKKHEKLREICAMYDVSLNEICHIGDNLNDLYTGEQVGLFIGLNAKDEKVKAAAHYNVADFFQIMEIFDLK
jgi:phosphoserine phosphatase